MYGLHSENYQDFSSLKSMADYALHVFLPVTCMSVFSLAGLAMYSRTSMLDVVNQDYIRTARAKGLPERTVVLKHALRNALIPIITLFSNFLPALLGGSVIVEWLFGIPGMGRLSFVSIQEKDYNTLMALIYIDAIVVMLSILVSDLLYVIVDPRISFEKAGGGE
jgi:peptide/nickel transport system permease protein